MKPLKGSLKQKKSQLRMNRRPKRSSREISATHVAMYLSQIGSIPIMPQVEANRCIEKVQKGNAAAEQLETLRVIAEESGNAVDPEIKKDLMKAIEAGRRAKDKVVEGNLRLVVSIAKKYINSADSMVFMDLIQEGNIGLMRSIDSFDISRNVKFSTYATFWIRQNITRALATTCLLYTSPSPRDRG